MNKIGLSETQDCQYCGLEETIDHFLLFCPRYYSHRVILRSSLNNIGVRNISREVLLGGGNFDAEIKVKINKILCIYLKSCNREL